MLDIFYNVIRKSFYIGISIFSFAIKADNFDYNIYNNHGVLGLINTPSARFNDEGVHGITIYNGNPDQKITLTSSPYNWMEASFFYMNIEEIEQCRANPVGEVFCQGYKDKGFNIKLRLKEEGVLPAIAIGLNDFAGTGLYGSEYIVSSYGINNLDIHFGLGWGQLGESNKNIKNPFGYIRNSFKNRPGFEGQGGQFNYSKFFSGKTAAPFYGISYSINQKILFKFEKDTTLTNNPKNLILYDDRKNDYSFGIDYSFNDNFVLGASYERGNYLSFKFLYKNNPKRSLKQYEYKRAQFNENESKYTKLIKNLEENDIGVNKIFEGSRSIGLDLSQFVHGDIRLIEQIIKEASNDAGIKKDIKKDIKIADLKAVNEIDESFYEDSNIVYERKIPRQINTSNNIRLRPFLASREEFFKGAILAENNTEFILKENLFINTNLKYSLANNFEDLSLPPVDTYPAQVRSDIKQYLKNMDKGILIGRAQIDYHHTLNNSNHIMLTAGILEDMFSGYGFEYLYYKQDKNYSFGIEIFKVKKRDYEWGFGHLDYENTIITATFYVRNYGLVPFDMKISAGEYLAGDIGSTIELTRKFSSGVEFGVFATFTDVTFKEFGEGSFDKGIFFKIPIYGNLIDYTWRPLTKDPGAKLIRRNTLHDLLVKFRPLE